MAIEITIPSPGESITEVTLGTWHKQSSEWVEKDEPLVEVESDKATLEIPAPESGLLQIKARPGTELKVGAVIGTIDPKAPRPAHGNGSTTAAPAGAPAAPPGRAVSTAPAAPASPASPAPAAPATTAGPAGEQRATPLARKIAADRGVDLSGVTGTGTSGRITKADVLGAGAAPVAEPAAGPAAPEPPSAPGAAAGARGVRRERMTRLRQRIAQRLVEAQHTAAMLTTFNEADMTAVTALRQRLGEPFKEKYGVGLGFMGFFVRACAASLASCPRLNAFIAGEEIEYHDFVDMAIAVSTERGLVVPVLRDAHAMSFAQIEGGIRELATRAREGKLSIAEMTGGTFTISNGGVYGSLNSTPILNPPQSGILGMHKIMNRPVEDPAHPGQVALRPMMYLALSYDHRIVDGAEAVRFLVNVKALIEDPERLLVGL
jgi:2-oxoglutarate dehydrogenase E2 component (dihydrolipoamide succinyltransferase)